MIQNKRTSHRFSSERRELIVLVRKHPCGTYNLTISSLTVAHWPVDRPDQTPGRSCKGMRSSLRADLPKLVTHLWDSEPASKVCFDRLSAPHHSPHPNRASINPSCSVPRSWSCVHINCQFVATGGKQKVKARAGHPDSTQEVSSTQKAQEAQRPRPQSQHKLPSTHQMLPQRPFQQ